MDTQYEEFNEEFSTYPSFDVELSRNQLEILSNGQGKPLSLLCNILAFLYHNDHGINWCGLYFLDKKTGNSCLGPFQGKVACETITAHKGVIGNCIDNDVPVYVPDVSKFPGHIACDMDSRSELVVPLRDTGGKTFGVLDIDSDELSHFTDSHITFYHEAAEILSSLLLRIREWSCS